VDGSPLSDSEEREIAAALTGRPRGRTSGERSVGASIESLDPPPPSSSSESAASVPEIHSEDAERALAELDALMGGGPAARRAVAGAGAIAARRHAGHGAISDSNEGMGPVPDLRPPPAGEAPRPSDGDLASVASWTAASSAPSTQPKGFPAVQPPAPQTVATPTPSPTPSEIDGGWKRVGSMAGGRLGKPGRTANGTGVGTGSGSGGVPAVVLTQAAPIEVSLSAPTPIPLPTLIPAPARPEPPAPASAPPPLAPPPAEDEEVPGAVVGEESDRGLDDVPLAVETPSSGDDRGAYPEPPPLPVVQGDDEPTEVAPEAPAPEHELFFGELARLQRFVTPEQVAEALHLSEKLREDGRPKKLGKIMVKMGFLTATQAKYLLKLQRTPDPIAGYKLLERRGQGGMGVVYRAVQKSMRREVALKILAPKWAAHARFLQRFFREAKLAGTLNHPNIVSAIDVGECNGLHYYAMEYVDGWSVAEMLKEDGPFDEGEALDLVVQVAKALKEASAYAIVHRDVKPENILITPDGVAKLADLGLSKQMTSDCSITTEGKTLGTPFYVSPELARGQRDVDVRSDIYSLGATLYHMLSGAPPFEGDQPAMIMARHIAEAHVPLRKVRPDVSQAVSRLVDRMMAKDPAKRYATADDLIKDVVAIRKGKNPFAPAGARSSGGGARAAERSGRREAVPDSDSDSNSTRMQAQPSRRVITSPERPAFGAGRSSTQSAGIVAAAVAILCVVVAVAVASKGKTEQTSGASAASGASAVAEAPPAPAPPAPVSAERERTVQARFTTGAPEVGQLLLKGKYEEASRVADGLVAEAHGSSLEGPARDLRDRVARETRTASDMALRSARRALSENDARRAQDFLDSAPRLDTPEHAQERARLKDEIERALRASR